MKCSRKLVCHLIISLSLYIIAGWFLRIIFDYYSSNVHTSIIKWLTLRIELIQFLYLILGFISIFMYYWHKPWRYLYEIIDAAESLYKKNDCVVKLSEPLKEIEIQMNQIKMSVIMADQAIKIAESKKSELVAYIAHDIRTPLTSIIGYLSLIKDMPELTVNKRQEYAEILLDKAMHLEQMVNEFFEITQYNTQKIEINKQNVDLYYLFIQLTDEFYPMLKEKGNTLKLEIDENLYCSIDPEKMSRAFSNLLKNAINYSYLKTEIFISAEIYNNKLVVVFKNQGETLSDEDLSHIFEKFSRLVNSRTSGSKGAGLGLSIAKEIIHLHNGEIVAQSKDETITFIITIPI
ncbi:VanS [Lacrimispora algidixylanolytica]|uniref:histidine kinase n=1 Tax=Lacrimispora algidixylanolytica TaxID=94868 RepID=A0A419TD66_9FIRM|nr:VanS [Lacrimispora algidixylanolytica]